MDLEVQAGNIILATLACLLLVACFGAIALLLTSLGKARGASLGIASAIALGGYFIDSLSGTVRWLEWPSKLFPFHYYDPEALLRGSISWWNILFFLAVIAACSGAAWLAFRKRDIY